MPNRLAEPVEERLDRYLSGERTSTEMAAIDAYFSAHPTRERAVRALFDALSRSGQTPPDVARAWATMRMRIEQDLVGTVFEPATNHPFLHASLSRREQSTGPALKERRVLWTHPLRRAVWSVAAGLVVGVLGIVMGWHELTRQGTVPVSRYATKSGERATITLPDGNTVTLDVASQLDVPVDYATGNHTVHLTGEALFAIIHQDGAPFTVMAGSATARVLGTNFAMRHYPTDTTALVAVREGKVAVGNVVVTASRLVEVGPRGGMRLRQAVPSQFGFATGVLQLDSMPLSRAVVELDRWYAADIRLGDPSLARVAIEGKFTAGSLSDLGSVLQLMLDARVVRDGKVLTLFPRAR